MTPLTGAACMQSKCLKPEQGRNKRNVILRMTLSLFQADYPPE